MIEPGTLTGLSRSFYFYLSSCDYVSPNNGSATGLAIFIFTGFDGDGKRFEVSYQPTGYLDADERELS